MVCLALLFTPSFRWRKLNIFQFLFINQNWDKLYTRDQCSCRTALVSSLLVWEVLGRDCLHLNEWGVWNSVVPRFLLVLLGESHLSVSNGRWKRPGVQSLTIEWVSWAPPKWFFSLSRLSPCSLQWSWSRCRYNSLTGGLYEWRSVESHAGRSPFPWS